jgi:hypothetical protein
MATQQIAQGLAGLGRNGDSVLVHMQPREVVGLQQLAQSHGKSLSTNPHTGMPEAFDLGDIFSAVAPIGLGMLLGPAGLGLAESALGAGLMTGAAGFALSGGDLGTALSAGLGGAGGFGLGESLGSIGKSAAIPEIAKTGAGVDAVPGAAAFEKSMGLDKAYTAGMEPAKNLIGGPSKYSFGNIGTGAKEVIADPMQYWKSGQIGWKDAATVASPLLMAGMEQPQLKPYEDTSYKMKYEGPYTAQDRKPRMPTAEEQLQLQAQGSPEFSYFGESNPYPGFNKAAGYAEGGLTQLYENRDGNTVDNTPADGYGLGRLQQLSQGGATAYAGGGMIAFDNGGQVPAVAANYAVAPTDLSQVAAIQSAGTMPSASGTDIFQGMLGRAISDPMGRINQQPTQGSLGGIGGFANALGQMRFGDAGAQNAWNGIMGAFAPGATGQQAATPRALTMQDYIDQARRVYDPSATARTIETAGAPEQAQFSNINPQQPVAKAMGGGIHSLAKGGRALPGGYLDGAGDGMSDSIPATIGEKQPARLADGEFVIPADVVSHLGNGSTKAGAKHLYKVMDKVRQARTGSKKQGKQINPNRFMAA